MVRSIKITEALNGFIVEAEDIERGLLTQVYTGDGIPPELSEYELKYAMLRLLRDIPEWFEQFHNKHDKFNIRVEAYEGNSTKMYEDL